MSVNGELIMDVDPGTNFYEYGNFTDINAYNPWLGSDKMAPFDRDVSLWNIN